MTLGARALGHTLFEFLAHGVGLRLGEAPGDVIDNALKRPLQRAAAVCAFIIDGEFFRTRAVENDVERFLRQSIDGVIQGKMIFFRQQFY